MYFEVLIHILKMRVPLGTKIQALAWMHASSSVTDYVTRAVTTPENQCHMIQPAFRGPLSLTDAVALDHRLGLENCRQFLLLGGFLAVSSRNNEGRHSGNTLLSKRRGQDRFPSLLVGLVCSRPRRHFPLV